MTDDERDGLVWDQLEYEAKYVGGIPWSVARRVRVFCPECGRVTIAHSGVHRVCYIKKAGASEPFVSPLSAQGHDDPPK